MIPRTVIKTGESNLKIQMNALFDKCDASSPFLLGNESAYLAWRQNKLEAREQLTPQPVFELNSAKCMSTSIQANVQRQIDAFNFCLFETSMGDFGKSEFIQLNRQFGLCSLDSNLGADADKVTALRVVEASDQRAQYIPYTNRAMNWHTDGYYNNAARRVNAFALYCVSQAQRGGGNYLFDHEMMYLLIRDQSPDLLQALLQEDLMHIPANVQGTQVLRAGESGPVFSLQPDSCVLNMRYTSRPYNIVWKSDPQSQRALDLVREILLSGSAMIEVHLQPGQGMICNNILHGRQAFQNDSQGGSRLVYRARYHDAINLERGSALAGSM
jgi:hypothetical protein